MSLKRTSPDGAPIVSHQGAEIRMVGFLRPCPCPDILNRASHTAETGRRLGLFDATVLSVGLAEAIAPGGLDGISIMLRTTDGRSVSLVATSLVVLHVTEGS